MTSSPISKESEKMPHFNELETMRQCRVVLKPTHQLWSQAGLIFSPMNMTSPELVSSSLYLDKYTRTHFKETLLVSRIKWLVQSKLTIDTAFKFSYLSLFFLFP